MKKDMTEEENTAPHTFQCWTPQTKILAILIKKPFSNSFLIRFFEKKKSKEAAHLHVTFKNVQTILMQFFLRKQNEKRNKLSHKHISVSFMTCYTVSCSIPEDSLKSLTHNSEGVGCIPPQD